MVPESAGETEVSLIIPSIQGAKRRFALNNLSNPISGVTIKKKPGKNTVVLTLQKKEEKTWHGLIENTGKGGGDDEEGGGMGGKPGLGGMGGMPAMGGMGSMPGMGGKGGMDMASIMGAMGGMGGM